MKACLLTLSVTFTLFTGTLLAADERQLALALKAQSDFERVQLAARSPLADSEACLQSQAAAISVSPPEDLALLHFRKGWCALAEATVTGAARQFQDAAAEFDLAKAAWPSRMRKGAKNQPAEPVSGGLRAIAGIARFEAGTGDAAELREVLAAPVCNSNLMPADFCGRILGTARQWVGWVDLRNGKVEDSIQEFSFVNDSGWLQWALGRRSFDAGSYREAATRYAQAIEIWKAVWSEPSVLRALGPRPAIPVALTDLGGAQFLAGDLAAAIRTLDASVKADPSEARPFFLRARAKELSGQGDAALADYNLASRTAFAAAQDLASGEAHLYRGILLYRRKDFARAEDEFASALNFEIAEPLRGDASAWRYLAAVAGGACGSARTSLEQSIAQVSPYFPKNEARTLASACAATAQR
jgi:tetratricopeptide (TPR) repeat protein